MITVDAPTVEFGGTTLFKDISFQINPKDCVVAYLPQHLLTQDKRTVFDETCQAFAHLHEIQAEIDRINNMLTTRTDYESPGYTLLIEKLSALSERFYAIDSTHFDEHVEKTLLGLGFQSSDFNRPTSQLSGGWRMRIQLAKLLLKAPDFLLAEVGAEVYGFGVSDDGTMVGFYGGAYGPRVGFLWKAGESDIQRLATAFPGATRLADYDEGFFNTPCAISADGRYIAGFAHISPEDLNEDEYYVSWVLDTQDPDAAGSASDVAPIVVKDKDKVAKIKALYSLDGARRNTLSKGINILRMSDGKSLKKLVKYLSPPIYYRVTKNPLQHSKTIVTALM